MTVDHHAAESETGGIDDVGGLAANQRRPLHTFECVRSVSSDGQQGIVRCCSCDVIDQTHVGVSDLEHLVNAEATSQCVAAAAADKQVVAVRANQDVIVAPAIQTNRARVSTDDRSPVDHPAGGHSLRDTQIGRRGGAVEIADGKLTASQLGDLNACSGRVDFCLEIEVRGRDLFEHFGDSAVG